MHNILTMFPKSVSNGFQKDNHKIRKRFFVKFLKRDCFKSHLYIYKVYNFVTS